MATTQSGPIRLIRKLIIGIIGGGILFLGIALIFLPGPAFVFIPLGLGILSLEFEWPRRVFQWVRSRLLRQRRQDEHNNTFSKDNG
ncbi:MAG TPA: PGPGW domain-containing protein [Bacteroidota bacterium]|nr:PGPGW domain-containing protein [Bacteroidota bacterium]